ncbi:hypothetical protein SDC9_87081 [bioreactor metagenome]|uniref:Uncharacterized protein n=1 Tax=bioreactor metagenome TaxID=1076179 RepID=A0A644ZHU3_9ZZZZ
MGYGGGGGVAYAAAQGDTGGVNHRALPGGLDGPCAAVGLDHQVVDAAPLAAFLGVEFLPCHARADQKVAADVLLQRRHVHDLRDGGNRCAIA